MMRNRVILSLLAGALLIGGAAYGQTADTTQDRDKDRLQLQDRTQDTTMTQTQDRDRLQLQDTSQDRAMRQTRNQDRTQEHKRERSGMHGGSGGMGGPRR